VPGFGHGSIRENTPAAIKQLGGDYPIAGLNPYPIAARGLLSGSVADLASNYAPHVETWIGDRSVFLVGGSFGGVVAMAVASELEHRGRHVAGVVLLDTQAAGIGGWPSSMREAEGWIGLMKMYGLNEGEGEKLAELVGAPSTLAVREMIRDNLQCLNYYTLPAVTAPIHLFHAREWHADTAAQTREGQALQDWASSRRAAEVA